MSVTQEALLIVARVRDLVTPGLNRIGREAKTWSSRMVRVMGSVARAAGRIALNLAKVATLLAGAALVAGTYAMVRLASSMSDAAAAATELEARFSVVFGEGADDAREFADTLATGLGRGRNSMRALLAESRTFFGSMQGLSEDTATAMSKAVVQFSQDLASFYDQNDEETLRLLRSAMVGNAEAMDRFGARVTEAEVANHDFIRSLKEQGIEATNDEKALARLEILTTKLSAATGNAAREAENFTSRMKFLRGVIQDAQVEFGADLNEAIIVGIEQGGGMERLQGVIRVFFASVGEGAQVAAAAALQAAGSVADWIDKMGGPAGVIAKIGDSGERAVGKVRLAVLELQAALEKAQSTAEAVVDAVPAFRLSKMAMDTAFGAAFGPDGGEREELRQTIELVQKYSDRLNDLKVVRDGFRSGQYDPEGVDYLTGETFGDLFASDWRENVEALMAAQTRLEELKTKLGPTVTKIVELQMELAGGASAAGAGGGGLTQGAADQKAAVSALSAQWEKFTGILNRAKGEMSGAKGGLDEVTVETDKAAGKFDTARTSAQGLVSALFAIGQGASDAGSAFRSLALNVAQGYLQAQVGSFFADGGIAQGGFSNAVPVKGYADGGPVFRKPHLAMIGEGRYNEAAVPLPDGRRIPVDMRGGGGGGNGGSTTVNFSVFAADARSVTELLSNDAEGLASIIAQQLSTSPTFRAQLGGGLA